jgi:hypothetical protein
MAILIFFNGVADRGDEFIAHGNLFYKFVTAFDPCQDAGEVSFHVAGQYAVAFFGVHPGGDAFEPPIQFVQLLLQCLGDQLFV